MKKEICTHKEIYISIFGIMIGEFIMFYADMLSGLGIHIVNFLIIILMIIFGKLSLEEKNVLQSLTLLILLRMINISAPQFFTGMLMQYPIIYGVMFLPIYMIIKNQQIHSNDIGINFGKLYIYVPIAIAMGIVVGIIEYRIIEPMALVEKIRFSDVALISIVMFVFIGITEELVFRSIIQTRLEKILGLRHGLLLTGVIFGIMHVSYGTMYEISFAIIFGVVVGYIFQRTRNLMFVTSIHGTTNVVLFGILPNMSTSIVANTQRIPVDIMTTGGAFMSIFLIMIFSISFLISDTKYWNEYISYMLGSYYGPLLLVFMMIVIYKIELAI